MTWSGPGHCQALLRLARLGRGASHNALQWIPGCTDGADQRGKSIGIEHLVGSGFSYGHSVTEMWCIAVGWRQASWNVGVNEVQSRVPAPASGACSPGISRAIYGMPIVAPLHVPNLEAIVHLQRWQFQDLMVFTAARPPGSQEAALSQQTGRWSTEQALLDRADAGSGTFLRNTTQIEGRLAHRGAWC